MKTPWTRREFVRRTATGICGVAASLGNAFGESEEGIGTARTDDVVDWSTLPELPPENDLRAAGTFASSKDGSPRACDMKVGKG